uniref:kelch-like protein 13 n=1 Tax=Styela clava TaxID=7725 RepID=UPI00193949EE|nr:kelch-like protein 13 [Styela clava]
MGSVPCCRSVCETDPGHKVTMGGGASKNSKRVSNRTDVNGEKTLSMPFANTKEHVSAMLQSLSSFQRNNEFCDLKLQVVDKETRQQKTCFVHKCILAACSGYCKEKLEADKQPGESGTKEVIPSGTANQLTKDNQLILSIEFPIPGRIVDLVIKYLYTADLDLKVKDIPDVLEAAVRLKIPSLKKHCVWGLHNGYIIDFFRPILQLSEELELTDIREFVLRRTIEKFDDFVDSIIFVQLTEKEIQILVDNRRGCVSDGVVIPEVEMFNGILKWEKHNHKEREEYARQLLRHLHYHKIPKTTLSGYVITHELVSGDKQLMTSIEEVLGADKKKILQRLRQRTLSQGHEDGNELNGDIMSSNGSGDGPVFPTQPCLLVCGGRLFDQMSAQVLQLSGNSWHEVSRIPTVLSHHGATVIDNSLYIAGGEDTTISGCHSIPNLWKYDPHPRHEWTVQPDMNHSRSFFHLDSLNDYLFVFGGRSGKIVRSSVEKFNVAAKRWEFVASLKTPRHSHAGCAHKNMLYVNGGIVGKHSSVDMLRLDAIANHWTTMSPMRCARSRHSMTPVRDRIYVIGGEDDSLGVTRSSSIAIECYTPEYDQWHSVALKIPVQSDGEFGCTELDGHIFVAGGCKSQLAEHRAEVSSYDPEEDRWEVKPKLPRRLRGSTCVVLNMIA